MATYTTLLYRALGAMGVNVSDSSRQLSMWKGREMGRSVVVERAEAHGATTMLVYGKGDTLGLEDSENLNIEHKKGKMGLGFGKQHAIEEDE
ncbi:hypothetical protein LR48_Vigan04g125800 [Vigna angularis]|uniref:Uncharacterized protein n=1 Tax=Phaseolus angularis TaxID=3914 RepID=A0A0L9UDR8_PHAAN|nr:hypothetical protein LR48_Vigan04g125800 [Vigna angularis]